MIDDDFIVLTDDAIQRVMRQGEERNTKDEGVPDRRICRRIDSVTAHRVGFAAEDASGTRFNVPVDLSINRRGGDKKLRDLTVGPYGAQIRCPLYYPPELKYDDLSDFKTDIAILCYRRPHTRNVRFYGWVTRKDFERYHVKKNYGHGEKLVMFAKDLRPMSALDAELSRVANN